MSRASILMILGILVILTPFSGLPVDLRTLLTVIFGAAIFGISFFMRSTPPPPSIPSDTL